MQSRAANDASLQSTTAAGSLADASESGASEGGAAAARDGCANNGASDAGASGPARRNPDGSNPQAPPMSAGAGAFITEAPYWSGTAFPTNPEAGAGPFTTERSAPGYGPYGPYGQ
jgi:hypothetical protein